MRLLQPDLCTPPGVPALGREDPPLWTVHAAQLLEDHHLCAWSRTASLRARFAAELAHALARHTGSRVCTIDGSLATSLPAFCDQLARGLGLSGLDHAIDSRAGVVAALRVREDNPRVVPIRRRYYVWSDADTLLKADPALFGRLVDALAGVAAESEFASDDCLIIHRVVFVGSPALDLYAHDPGGQFRRWAPAGHEPGRRNWARLTGIDAPPIRRFEIVPDHAER
jgi:hypothetical protein